MKSKNTLHSICVLLSSPVLSTDIFQFLWSNISPNSALNQVFIDTFSYIFKGLRLVALVNPLQIPTGQTNRKLSKYRMVA